MKKETVQERTERSVAYLEANGVVVDNEMYQELLKESQDSHDGYPCIVNDPKFLDDLKKSIKRD